ncbi:MAG: PAS domain S-box protein, partial [Planctomycetia bacterium]|nr:PAS domain S-box protein [Planctomycetia bacterium]
MSSSSPTDDFRLSEARRQALVQAALDAIVSMDCAGTILEFNPAAERTFGYRRSDAVGRNLAELLIPPGLRPAHRKGLAHYLASGEGPVLGRRVETTAMRADGSEFPIELSITTIHVGGTLAFTAFIRDLTERRRAEEARTRLIDILEATSDLVASFDPAGQTLWLNRAARRLLGVPLGETAPRLPLKSFHPEWACKRIFREGIPAAERAGVWWGETALRTADGRQVPTSQVLVVHRAPGGAVEYFSTILRDISAQKEAEVLL